MNMFLHKVVTIKVEGLMPINDIQDLIDSHYAQAGNHRDNGFNSGNVHSKWRWQDTPQCCGCPVDFIKFQLLTMSIFLSKRFLQGACLS